MFANEVNEGITRGTSYRGYIMRKAIHKEVTVRRFDFFGLCSLLVIKGEMLTFFR